MEVRILENRYNFPIKRQRKSNNILRGGQGIFTVIPCTGTLRPVKSLGAPPMWQITQENRVTQEGRRIPWGLCLFGFVWWEVVASCVRLKQKPSSSSFGLNVENISHRLMSSISWSWKIWVVWVFFYPLVSSSSWSCACLPNPVCAGFNLIAGCGRLGLGERMFLKED